MGNLRTRLIYLAIYLPNASINDSCGDVGETDWSDESSENAEKVSSCLFAIHGCLPHSRGIYGTTARDTAKSDAVASTVAQSRCIGKWTGRSSLV